MYGPTLNEALVVRMRTQARENPDLYTAKYFATQFGISESTIGKAIRGDTYKSLNSLAPPFIKNQCAISDEIVIEARRTVKADPSVLNRDLALKYNVPMNLLERAIRGDSYNHLNHIEVPIKRILKNEEKIALVRDLYSKGMSYREISKELKVSKSSLSAWLKDIVRPPKQANGDIESFTAPHPYSGYTVYTSVSKSGDVRYRLENKDTSDRTLVTRARYNMSVHVGRILSSDEIVVRKEGKSDDIENLVLYTKEQYRIKRLTDRSSTCVECNTPFEKKRGSVSTCSKPCAIAYRQRKKQETLSKRILVCKECSTEFTSMCNHAQFCSSKCRNSNMIKIRRASRPVRIKIEKPKVVKPPKIKVPKQKQYHNLECVICENEFVTSNKSREICYSKQCRDILNENLAYEEV